ncbi:MAG TPA: ABC transporter permease, partial [Ktedonobacterales bacterium]|nr:ABC transporter permease [Ktedonobacterales bacterium]
YTLGMDPQHTGKLTTLQRQQSGTGNNVTLAKLATNEAYLNSTASQDLDAHAGDTIAIFSPYWPQQRYQFHVRAILTDGPLGQRPTLVLPLAIVQGMVNAPNSINHIYIANAGSDLSSVDYSSAIAAKVQATLPHNFTVDQIKASAMTFALSAQDIFGHILFLYTLFALAIDLLLIFLIFTLLAAERRSELGAMRAIGMHRSDVVEMFLFEAGIYDTLAATPGALSGIGLGVIIILIISPEVAHFGFPLQISLDPQDIVVALCLGFLFTLAVAMLAAAVISRMTIAAALRNEPEPQTRSSSLPQLWQSLLDPQYHYRVRLLAYLRAGREFLWGITWRGMTPTVAGIVVLIIALTAQEPFLVTVGIASLLGGIVLLARWYALLRIARNAERREIDVAHNIRVV